MHPRTNDCKTTKSQVIEFGDHASTRGTPIKLLPVTVARTYEIR